MKPFNTLGKEVFMNTDFKQKIDKLVADHTILLFVKGTKNFPQCGFSNAVISIFKEIGAPFESRLLKILGPPGCPQ